LPRSFFWKPARSTGYRFYALYDKISREDILAHAFAQCRSNKGAPGVDGQDFADIDARRRIKIGDNRSKRSDIADTIYHTWPLETLLSVTHQFH
jgi:hypothetical protein